MQNMSNFQNLPSPILVALTQSSHGVDMPPGQRRECVEQVRLIAIRQSSKIRTGFSYSVCTGSSGAMTPR